MEGECRPSNADFKFFLQSINTPGNEITPGSDIVRKYFQCFEFGHDVSLYDFFLDWRIAVSASVHKNSFAMPDVHKTVEEAFFL